MNAHYVRRAAKDLNKYQRSVILGIALREVDDLPTRAKHLKKLAYCTDEAKFEVLKESDTVSEGLYDSLYELYFGTVQEDEPDVLQGEQGSEQGGEQDTMKEQEQLTEKRVRRQGMHFQKWTDERCIRLIEEYKKGLSTKVLGALFGVSHVAARQKIAKLKKDDRFRTLFADEQEEPKTAEPVTVSQEEMPQKKVGLPKAFTATGTGLLTVEDGLKLDGEPLLTMLRQEIVKRGVEQFYADVEIVIRPSEPKGMTVATEEEE